MSGSAAAQFTWLELLLLAAHWLFLWLGLYLLSNRPRSAPRALLAGAFVALSTYFLSAAFLAAPQTVPGASLWGTWLGGWIPFAPAFLLHAFLRLTGTRLPRQRLILALVYGAAALVYALSFSDTLIWRYSAPLANATVNVNGSTVPGRLYWLYAAQTVATLVLALFALVHARRANPRVAEQVRATLDRLVFGTALMCAAAALLFALVFYAGGLWIESLLDPILGLGAILVAIPFTRSPGLAEGQLLRTDAMSSLLGAALLMAAFTAVVLAAGGSFRGLAGLGWFALAVFVFADDLKSLADRAFYRPSSRAARAGLRAAAAYAGAGSDLDVATLTASQARVVFGYLEGLDRAGVAAARLRGTSDPRLALLGRDEFAPVRAALGLAPAWAPEQGLAGEDVFRQVAACLEPRERQALGLKYLGYSDKEMARFMGVRAGVPRSYLSEGKRKLGLVAGSPLLLFVHFSGLVGRDAMPLLAKARQAGRRR